MNKIYYVARIRPWHGGAHKTSTGRPSKRTYIQATTNLDCLSSDALSPIRTVRAETRAEAIESFRHGFKN